MFTTYELAIACIAMVFVLERVHVCRDTISSVDTGIPITMSTQ